MTIVGHFLSRQVSESLSSAAFAASSRLRIGDGTHSSAALANTEAGAPTSDMLRALIIASPMASVVDSSGKKSDRDLATLLGDALASQTLVNAGENARIVNIEGSCKEIGRAHGIETYGCQLSVGEGEYTRTDSGYQGPTDEGATVLNFKALCAISKSGDQKFPLRVQGKITVSFFD